MIIFFFHFANSFIVQGSFKYIISGEGEERGEVTVNVGKDGGYSVTMDGETVPVTPTGNISPIYAHIWELGYYVDIEPICTRWTIIYKAGGQ